MWPSDCHLGPCLGFGRSPCQDSASSLSLLKKPLRLMLHSMLHSMLLLPLPLPLPDL